MIITREETVVHHLKSKAIGHILLMFLWVSLGLSCVSGVLNLIYMYSFEVYDQHLTIIDHYLSSSNIFVYVIEVIIFLIWLYLIHVDLKRCYTFYPITPWGALLRNLPLVNIWGLANLYNTMGTFFGRNDAGTAKRIRISVPFLYITLFGLNFINKLIQRNQGDISDTLLLTSTAFEIAFSAVILIMAITITRGLALASLTNKDKLDMKVDKRINSAINDYMQKMNDFVSARSLVTEQFIREAYAALDQETGEKSLDEMVRAVQNRNRNNPALIHYKIVDYRFAGAECFEVCIVREFEGGSNDKVIYLLKKEQEVWRVDHIVRRLEGLVTEKAEAQGSVIYTLQNGDSFIYVLDAENNQPLAPNQHAAVWAYLETEERYKRVLYYHLFKAA
jgi:hypothetical protein